MLPSLESQRVGHNIATQQQQQQQNATILFTTKDFASESLGMIVNRSTHTSSS